MAHPLELAGGMQRPNPQAQPDKDTDGDKAGLLKLQDGGARGLHRMKQIKGLIRAKVEPKWLIPIVMALVFLPAILCITGCMSRSPYDQGMDMVPVVDYGRACPQVVRYEPAPRGVRVINLGLPGVDEREMLARANKRG